MIHMMYIYIFFFIYLYLFNALYNSLVCIILYNIHTDAMCLLLQVSKETFGAAEAEPPCAGWTPGPQGVGRARAIR